MSKKPIIGITGIFMAKVGPRGSYGIGGDYIKSIRMAGGCPVILSETNDPELIAQYVDSIDGFLCPGGADVAPHLYGEDPVRGMSHFRMEQDVFEIQMIKGCVAAKKPVFGICRGLQFLNAALGGTLYQDLPSERPAGISHRQTQSADAPCHSVMLAEGSPLQALLRADTISVNSFHHQAVKTLAPPLSVAALSEDRLVEAVWMPSKRFVRAVQWHPELSFMTDENSRRLFADFVAACCI